MATTMLLVDPTAAGERSPIGPDVVAALERVIAGTGLDASLRNRYSVVFAFPGMGVGQHYPELAGCTLEVCTFIDEAGVFAKHGIAVIGLSGERSEPPAGCLAIPFPVGVIEQDDFGEPSGFVEENGRRYAERATFVIFPDGTGVRVSGIADIVGHVRGCLDLVLEHRLERLRQATLAADLTGLRSTAQFGSLLPNGANSVAITRVDVTIPLVAKMAAPDVVREEAGYMRRINTLLERAGRPRLFPAIVAINADEDPAWYLMEAADPVSLDHVLFADAARTVVDPSRQPLLTAGIDRLSNLYELTYRHEVPPVARYHYRDRFAVIPSRADTRLTHQLLVGGGDLEEMLHRPVMIDGFACRSYREQLAFLEERVDDLVQPVGAYLHGDVHLPNMLIAGGDSIVFVDPRVVWDGNDVGDPGFGEEDVVERDGVGGLHQVPGRILVGVDRDDRRKQARTPRALEERVDPAHVAGLLAHDVRRRHLGDQRDRHVDARDRDGIGAVRQQRAELCGRPKAREVGGKRRLAQPFEPMLQNEVQASSHVANDVRDARHADARPVREDHEGRPLSVAPAVLLDEAARFAKVILLDDADRERDRQAAGGWLAPFARQTDDRDPVLREHAGLVDEGADLERAARERGIVLTNAHAREGEDDRVPIPQRGIQAGPGDHPLEGGDDVRTDGGSLTGGGWIDEQHRGGHDSSFTPQA